MKRTIIGNGTTTLRSPRPSSQAPEATATRGAVDTRPVGLFDSGVGGLTVLHECLVNLPHEDFIYLGDTGSFPYGPRPIEEVRALAFRNASFLVDQGVKL